MSTNAELLALQSNIKKDPDGYKDEFMLQYRHYQALLDIFKLRPSKESREFGELVMFMAQVSRAYPRTMTGFASEVCSLLDTHSGVLDSALRRTLVGALILMRNRGQVEAMAVLPLFFRLFRCQDKALRQQLFRHIVSDLKAANRKTRNERLNRSVQNFMYQVVSDENESAAKRGLAVLTEMWRRHVWRDARTVNVIASAAFHKSPRVLLAVMKFFLGEDRGSGEDGGGEDSDDEGGPRAGEGKKPSGPSKEDIYGAFHKGTRSSKKKKQAKLKRVQMTVKKAERRAGAGGSRAESFAAIHLLHDPQTFAEKLFSRLSGGGERFETRLSVMMVLSRVIGVHKLLVLNFYPYLQKYIAPHQRDVTAVLAALVQGAHDLVPPETMAPVLRQLVDQFVHDKARPEVMTVGLKTVSELALRCPLVVTEDLLRDLAQYKKFREKQVAAAARALIGTFRDINPEMLIKKDRGRAADLALKPREYGDAGVATRVDGAELLQAAIRAGRTGSDDSDLEDLLGGSGSEGGEDDDDLESLSGDEGDEGSEGWQEVSDDEEEAGGKTGAGASARLHWSPPRTLPSRTPAGGAKGKAAARGAAGSKKSKEGAKAHEEEEEDSEGELGSSSGDGEADSDNENDEGEEDSEDEGEGVSGSESGSDAEAGEGEEELDGSGAGSSGSEDEEVEEDEEGAAGPRAGRKARKALRKQRKAEREAAKKDKKRAPEADPNSLASLKRRLAEAQEAKKAKKQRTPEDGAEEEGAEEEGGEAAPGVPIEAERILTQEDFERIRKLKQRALIEASLAKHGLSSAGSRAKKARLLEAAEEEAAEALELRERLATIGEAKVKAEDLVGRHKNRKDKAARLASVLEGREGREKFGARSGLKKKKTAGLSEREKQRKKAMPMAARVAQIRRRNAAARGRGRGKNFKGHVRG